MAHITEDRVLETTTTTGTGALTLAGALTGFRTFSSVMAASDTCWYYIEGVDGSGNATGEFEAGLGTYNTTLTRTTVIRSSNSNAAVTLSAGTKRVGITLIAAGNRALQLDNLNCIVLPVTSSSINPTTPAAGTMRLYTQSIASLTTLRTLSPSGVDHTIQRSIAENGTVLYLPNNGTTVGLNYGMAWATFGTVSHPTPSSTSPAIYSQQKRTRWANVVTTANQFLGLGSVAAEKRYWRGNAAGLGGFNFYCRFAVGLWPAATVRLFVGLSDIVNTTSAGVCTTDTPTGNFCGFHHITTDAASGAGALTFSTRDGTTQNRINLTPAAALAAGQVYEAWIYSQPNGSAIGYRLMELNTGTLIADSTTSTNIPSATAFLGPELAMSNGSANVTVTTTAMEVMACTIQSDY